MAKSKNKRKKGRSKKKGGFGHSTNKGGPRGKRHHPTARAKQAYYANVRKAYKRLKPIAEANGFA